MIRRQPRATQSSSSAAADGYKRRRLALFSVGAVTEGTDAQARTTVRLEEDGKLVDGQGADADTVVSAVRAYVHALNKLLVKRARTAPEALTA